jgi:Mg2+/Co2+ transporter CorB
MPGGLPEPDETPRLSSRRTKKVSRGALTFILTRGIGQSFIAKDCGRRRPTSAETSARAGNDYTKLDIMKLAMKPWFVPDTTTLQDQLNAFLRRRSHFAIVIDEYGEVEGLLTLEDILEEIVGDISDEHDVDVQGVRQEADGSVVVDGSVSIRDLNRALGWSLPDEEATTIAGLVIHETQSIPKERQAFTFHGKRFVVMKRDKNRITRLRVKPIGEKSSAASN